MWALRLWAAGGVGEQNDLGLIDPNNIERIEIVKGASSALYGSDAIAGVINIITRKHDEGIMLEDKTHYGTYNDVRQHNGVALRWGKISSYTNFQLLATKQTKGDFPERGTQQGNARWLCAKGRTRGTDHKGDDIGRTESRGHRHADYCDYREQSDEKGDALFVFGNAPTALMELCDLMRHGKAHPQGIIAAPVGFVHVKESKHMAKSFTHVPKIIIEGRKGGSNIAATLCNAIMTLDDAEQLKPGRDL